MFSTVPSAFISGVERFDGKGDAAVHREKDTQRSGGFITHPSGGVISCNTVPLWLVFPFWNL